MGPGDSNPNLTPLVIEEEATSVGAGTRLGKYELLRRLSIGGMAEIFLARAVGLPGFQMLVAVKKILPQLAADPGFLEMFLDEARIAATLQHPHIVQIYDVACASGSYFISMEYLHGEDVRAILRAAQQAGRRIPLEHVVQIMIALCSGLHYAHEKEGFDGKPLDIVHCDVSPGNVIVTYEGGIKLLDFGIASAAIRSHRTQTGALRGKIGYMSPEQARSEPIDRRTDVFAAGVILYELSTGRKLHKIASDYEMLKRVAEAKFARPRELDPSYDERLEQIVLRALDPDRSRRYQTAVELQMDLETLARQRKLFLSSNALKRFMGELFGQKVEAWRTAQKEGKSLVEHLELVAEDESADEAAAAPTAAQVASAALPALVPVAPRRRWVVPVAAGAAVLLVLVAGVLGLRGRTHATAKPEVAAPEVAAPATAPEPAPPPSQVAPSPAAPSQVAPSSARATASVKVVTHPHGALLSLDGRASGLRSPSVFEHLPPGAHTITARLDRHKELARSFTLAADQHATITLSLTRADAPAAPSAPAAPATAPQGEGALAIVSNPWCNVTVDGVARGQTPLNVKLPAGSHSVTLTNPDYHVRRQLTVRIVPNETLRKKLDFTE
jgi:serine/threonine protein kinase